jgi:hypothetical protein
LLEERAVARRLRAVQHSRPRDRRAVDEGACDISAQTRSVSDPA